MIRTHLRSIIERPGYEVNLNTRDLRTRLIIRELPELPAPDATELAASTVAKTINVNSACCF
ncbi:hypothetical protein [Tessaracoccus caeni]|uniref:hypothetical protein n=1 Tax=Tessaracoccus caeni TaxID=3031239 RepID=UPI0023DB555C|nr:hypothetical protein [Tessaracoccus caeni]MDF1487803.1 hypothetical protein [Tessaracoccus caeni]